MEEEVIIKLLGGLRETAEFLMSAFAVFYLHKTIDRLAVCLLNLPAFLFHGIQRLIDDEYRKAYDHASRKIDFFRALRYEVNRCFHKNWASLFRTVSGHPPDG